MKRFLKRALIALLVLIVILILTYYFTIDSVIRSGVQTVATSAVGEPTTLQSASLHTFGGNLTLAGLTIANPKDFTAGEFLNLGSVSVTVKPGSLLSDTVEVPDITLDGLHLTIEQNALKNNLKTILDQIQAQTKPAAPATPAPSAQPQPAAAPKSAGKNLKIGVIKLTNTQVTIRMSAVPGYKGGDVTAKIKEMTIADPTNADGRPMKIADLIGKVLVQVASAAGEDTGGAFKDALKSATGFLQGSDLTKQFGQGAKSVTDNLQKGVGDAVKGLGGLFDHSKPTTAPK